MNVATEKTSTGPGKLTENRLFDAVLLGMAVAAVAAFLINQIYDLDVWWHLVIGKDILARLAVPDRDRFALAALGRPYHDSHWLFQAVLAGAHRLGGMAGVQLLMVAVWGGALFVCRRAILRWTSSGTGSILLFFAAMACIERFLPRPEMVTLLMICLFYLRLQEECIRTPGDVALLGGAQVIWANCHGLFVLGPFMAGCYWIVAVWNRLRGAKNDVAPLTRLTALLLAATLATPFGVRGWEYAVLLFREADTSSAVALKNVGELSPTLGRAAMSAPAFWFFAFLLVAACGVAIAAAVRRGCAPQRVLIVAAMGVAALSGRRNMALFALVAAPFVAEHLRFVLPARPREGLAVAIRSAALLAMAAMVWFSLSGQYYLRMEIPSRFGLGATPSFFPHDLPQFIRKSGFRGQVFNSNNLGGFYLYHFYPQQVPLTDGRWEIYERTILDGIQRAPADPLLWQQMVLGYGITGILLQHTSSEAQALLPVLPMDPRWRLVYYDYAASFWMRTDVPNLPPPVDLTSRALPRFPGRVDDCLILDAFLERVGAAYPRLENLQRMLSFGWKQDQALERIGMLQIRMRLWKEAERTFMRLNREYPANLTALNELAFMAYRRGDVMSAEYLLRKALDLNPDNQEMRQNYQRIRGNR
ncbi:tetratricopeptide repeat protein [Oryzomonas japonica]|uniref:Tetratricopeptide repeat protein n=1 Tax=Oryzomonas japonica TaxID=2603858 RepID=A0A7J4ZNW1_9BACT|nr:tetratricopeptide repeat protein [Oryzomonas japonica]KAB0664489.1 tetratricopeptide repeat protein [Oryzomonas japonica]